MSLFAGLEDAYMASKERPYYEAIGRFIVAYAQAECIFHELARKLSGLKEEKARVLFAGMRVGDIKTRILALLRLSKRARATKDDIEACLSQFDVIGTQRDKLVHRYANFENSSLKITNAFTSKSMLSYEQDMFGIADLLSLQADCLIIFLRISHIVHPYLRRAASKSALKEIHGSWRYKLVPPKIQKIPSRAREIAKLLNRPPSSGG